MPRDGDTNWPTLPFSDAVEINPKRPLPKSGAVPFLDMASLPLNGGVVEVGRIRPVTSGGARFRAGDTLLARITPCAENGKLGFVGAVVGGGVGQGSTEFIVMAAREGVTEPEYVRFLAAWDYVRGAAIGLMEGTSGRQRVPSWAFDQIDVAVPPLDQQRRIVEVLRSVDDTISAQSKVCRQLEVTFNSLAEACFTEAGGTENWPVSPLGELCESIQVGIVVRPASYYVESGGIPALRSLNVGENRLDLEDLVHISAEGHRLNSKSSLRPGDVVTRRTGEPGKTAVIPPRFPHGLNCIDIIFSRPKANLRPEFLTFFMNSDAAKRQVAGLQGGLAQQHLNVSEMKKLRVPVPAIGAQDEVVATLKAAWDRVDSEKALLQRLLTLRTAISSELLSGRIRVPA